MHLNSPQSVVLKFSKCSWWLVTVNSVQLWQDFDTDAEGIRWFFAEKIFDRKRLAAIGLEWSHASAKARPYSRVA